MDRKPTISRLSSRLSYQPIHEFDKSVHPFNICTSGNKNPRELDHVEINSVRRIVLTTMLPYALVTRYVETLARGHVNSVFFLSRDIAAAQRALVATSGRTNISPLALIEADKPDMTIVDPMHTISVGIR